MHTNRSNTKTGNYSTRRLRLNARHEVGLSGDSKTTSSTLYEGRGVRRADEGSEATLSGNGSMDDSPAAGAAAVGEYTGLAKLKVFVSISAETNIELELDFEICYQSLNRL